MSLSPCPCPHLHVPIFTSLSPSPCPHCHVLVPMSLSPSLCHCPHPCVLVPILTSLSPSSCPCPHHPILVPMSLSLSPSPCPHPHLLVPILVSLSPSSGPCPHLLVPILVSLSPSPSPCPPLNVLVPIFMFLSPSLCPCPHLHVPIPVSLSPCPCPHLLVPIATSLSLSSCHCPHHHLLVPILVSLSPSPRPHPLIPIPLSPCPRPRVLVPVSPSPPPCPPPHPLTPSPHRSPTTATATATAAMSPPRHPHHRHPPSLPLLAFLTLLLLPPSHPHCHRAVGRACDVPPVPGVDILGLGLDVTTLSPTEGQALDILGPPGTPKGPCVICRDPLQGGRPLRLPPGVAKWRVGNKLKWRTTVAEGTSAVGTMVAKAEEVARQWRVGLGVALKPGVRGAVAVAGSHSRVAEFGMQRQREDRYGFASTEIHCVRYWISATTPPQPSPHFLRAVRALPPRFTPDTAADYGELLAAYGTHYIQSAQLGGRLRAVTAIRTCQATMAGLSSQEVADCLRAEMAASFGPVQLQAMANACKKARASNRGNASFNEVFNERLVEVEGGEEHGDIVYGRPEAYSRWLKGLPRFPGLVAANVRSLHTLVPKSDKRHGALRAAIGHYISWRALRANCSQACAGGGHLVGPCQCSCPANAAVTAGCCSRHRGTARVTVLVQEGQGWRGDVFTATDAYVRVFLGGRRAQTAPVWNNNHPKWGARLELGVLDLVPGAQLKVEVWDRDNGWDDDRLGTCTQPVEAGGIREVVCFAGKGRLKFSYQAACGPALGGPLCLDYVPQPPRSNGGLYHLSHWPPRPGDGPAAWPTQEEQEEEEEEDEGASLHGDLGESLGGSWGEDESWEDLGDVEDASREASVGVESSPGLQDSSFGLKKASPGHQNPNYGPDEDLLGLQNPNFGLKKASPGLQNPNFGLKKASPGLQDPNFSLQEDLADLQDPSSGLDEDLLGLQNPNFGPDEDLLGLQNPNFGLKKVSPGLQNPNFGLQEDLVDLQDPSSGLDEDLLDLQNPNFGLKKVSPGLRNPNFGPDEDLLGLQNPNFVLKKASPGLRNPKFGLQEDLQEPSSGSGEGPPAPQLGPPAPQLGPPAP
uniref:Perforin 1 n=1 Tax=Cairina moschata TaxID=8855 RepID=A0A8C3BLP9_CAIMO